MTEQLQKKIDRAIKLLQAYNDPDNPVEVAYSGGKDSDVILQLAKEAGINYRAIYKNTTIDPPGTIGHVREIGAEILRPRNGKNFFKLVEENGLPNRFMRFCCKFLKEYKVLDKAVMGVRKAESRKRAARYSEPTECRWYGAKKENNHVEAIYPILEWTDQDVADFIIDRGIKLAPVYYDADGTFHPERRLGCMCCPLASVKKRLEQFKERPNMVKAYVRAYLKWWNAHPNAKNHLRFDNPYSQIVRDFFFENQAKFDEWYNNMFGKPDCKQFLEDYFNIKL